MEGLEGGRGREDVRVSAFSSTFSWPSSRRKSSNLGEAVVVSFVYVAQGMAGMRQSR